MRPRSLIALAACLAAVVLAWSIAERGRAAPQPAPQPTQRVLVLGFDGADANVTQRLLDENRLPNLAALRARGGYSPLATSNPAQSPVAWASMTTGENPGETGIYDFLRRVFLPREPSPQIRIGLAEPVHRTLLDPVQRAAVVFLAGVLGVAIGGLLAFGVLARFDRGWRRGGKLQAALCGPAALLSVVALVVLGWLPAKVTHARNLRGGEPFWMTLDAAGLTCEALEAPLAFPAEPMEHGSCLAGLGVPDAQGTWGTWGIWTNDPGVPAETETAGFGFFVEPIDGAFDVVLAGPLDPRPDAEHIHEIERLAQTEKFTRELAHDWGLTERRRSETAEALLRLERRLTTPVHVELRGTDGATITTADGDVTDLVPGTWSDLVPVAFPISPLARFSARGVIPGRVRFLITMPGTTPGADGRPGTFRLFVAPVNIDAGAPLPPNLAISSPPGFARELAAAVGPTETLGWPELTNPVKDGMLEDTFFLEHLRTIMAGRERRLHARIESGGWDCLFAMFCETDRVQHVMWRHIDPRSPTYDVDVAPRFADAIDSFYVEMDRIVGEAVAAVGPDTHVLVVSDHGFAPFRRGVNLNNFLRAHGLQVPRSGVESGPMTVGALATESDFFPDVDWRRTRAYAMGLGNVYLNRKGRETAGIVTADDAGPILDEIRTKLLALRDTDGSRVVRDVYLGSDIYRGANVASAPDLVVGFERGYRVSWQTCLGSTDPDVINDNTQRWSADHCSVDPSLVPGILFSSLPLRDGIAPDILDVKPTLLDLLGVRAEGLPGASFVAPR